MRAASISPAPAASCSAVSHSCSIGKSTRARAFTSQPSSASSGMADQARRLAAHTISPGRCARAASACPASRSAVRRSPASAAAMSPSAPSAAGRGTPQLGQKVKHGPAAADRRHLGRGPAVAGVARTGRAVFAGFKRSTQVGAVFGEQPYPHPHVVRDRPPELPPDQLGRRVGPLAEAGPPRPAVAAAQPVAEQQHEVAVVAAELPVVQRLPVVGVGPGRQQRPGQREPVRVLRLVTLAARPARRSAR